MDGADSLLDVEFCGIKWEFLLDKGVELFLDLDWRLLLLDRGVEELEERVQKLLISG